mmetsp:Transcript_23584/g.57814  ORF Transcript_23584/g.57814 Transcript_23584/m.57814 type:complete len:99 (-) Transcript_23584:1459-1755(-)
MHEIRDPPAFFWLDHFHEFKASNQTLSSFLIAATFPTGQVDDLWLLNTTSNNISVSNVSLLPINWISFSWFQPTIISLVIMFVTLMMVVFWCPEPKSA